VDVKSSSAGGATAIAYRHYPNAHASIATRQTNPTLETIMANEKGPNIKKKAKCKNCEGKGLVKKGDKVVKCQRCHGTGVR
jgi:DnaJ-class molecular chaperone